MISQRVRVINPSGLHLRPAGELCREAMKYRSRIFLSFQDTQANMKSVLSVLGDCVKCNDEILITCEGEDENEALSAIVKAIQEGLGE